MDWYESLFWGLIYVYKSECVCVGVYALYAFGITSLLNKKTACIMRSPGHGFAAVVSNKKAESYYYIISRGGYSTEAMQK